MANEQERPAKPKGNRMKTAGKVLLWVGVVFLVIGIILYAIVPGCPPYCSNPERAVDWIADLAAFIAWGISCLFLLPGVILYFVGRSQTKKQNLQ